MYNVSTKYLELVQCTSRAWDLFIDLTLNDNTHLRITKDDINLNTAQLTEGTTCADTIQTGSTYSNSFEFTILNTKKQYTQYDFYKARVQPYVGLDLTGEGDFEYVPLGVFNILENVKKFSTIPVTCFDNMSKLNTVFKFSHLVFPISCATIFRELVAQCDIVCADAVLEEIEQLPYEINSLLTNDPTCRDILAGFGVMLQKNFRFNRMGVLEFFWYAPSGKKTDRFTRVGNSSYGDNQISITGVYLEDAYGNIFSVGTDEYPVELPSSPIIQGSEMAIPILESALTKLQEVAHRPATVTFIGDPAVQAGDVIVHTETAVGDVTLPVMRLVYKFAGTQTLESLGTSDAAQSQQTTAGKQLRKAFNKAAQDRAELETKIEQTADTIRLEASEKYVDRQMYGSLEVRIDGINAEVAHQTVDIDSVKQSIASVQQSAEQVNVVVQKIVADGVDKVVTSTGYTMDEDGLKIKKSGEEMENRLDNTGMYVTRSGETILQANNTGVVATDVQVRNYLIIGSHARFEDYNDGSDSKRTACFYI